MKTFFGINQNMDSTFVVRIIQKKDTHDFTKRDKSDWRWFKNIIYT